MARIIRTRASERGSNRWATLIAGAAVGALAAWAIVRGRRASEVAEPGESTRRRGGTEEPDLGAMTTRLRRVPGADGLRLRSLGGGILELVGSASSGLDIPALLHALASEPRVSVVVNRVWTDPEPTPIDSLGPDGSSTSTGS